MPSNITAACGNIPTAATLTATDACGSATVTFAETRTDGACAGSYTLTRKWTATDLCGNTAEHTQVVTVTDTRGPCIRRNIACGQYYCFMWKHPNCGYVNCDRCLWKRDCNFCRD
ncbi:hypothetical protein H9W95_12720 [Flavobacterium lindanitolerans]|nr:hypothetical protein [Flavobacterium lindanitolerans]